MTETPQDSTASSKDEETLLGRMLTQHLLKIASGLLLIGVVLILLVPYFFTQLSCAYDLTDKGQIGDAIGGTTAPITGLIGSFLVFLSLYAQIQANRLVIKEFKEEKARYASAETERFADKEIQRQDEMFRSFANLIQIRNSEIDSLRYEGFQGIDAIKAIAEQSFKGSNLPHFSLIKAITISIRKTVSLIATSNLRVEQNSLLVEQALLVTTKLEIAAYGLQILKAEGRMIENSPVASFLESLNETNKEILALKK